MQYHTYSQQGEYPVVILVNRIKADEIKKYYLEPYGLEPDNVMVISLHQSRDKKKTPAGEMKEYISSELVPVLNDLKAQYIIIGDAEYFKVFTKSTKADAMNGYIVPSAYGEWNCVYVPSYASVWKNPEATEPKIALGINAIKDHASGSYIDPGSNIIHHENYPTTIESIKNWLDILKRMNVPLTCDIEGWGLKPYEAGIATITFCWNQHEGVAFPVDYSDNPGLVRCLLREFFESFEQTIIYHHIAYDVMVLIYQLYMKNIRDTKGLLRGLKVLLRNWHDTRLITYLATNSCAGNKLGLKEQAQEFAGNYAVESINDITKIPLDQLLRYNLVDGLSTWYVFNKHWDTLVADKQLKIYNQVFKPAIVDIIQMQLTGLPLNMDRVFEVEKILQKDNDVALEKMMNTSLMEEFNYYRIEDYVNTKNNEWKKKRTTVQEVQSLIKTNKKLKEEIYFNPNSGPQLQDLLYNQLKLPVLALTDSGLPSTDADTLKKLQNHTDKPAILEFLKALLDYKAVSIILNTFIPAFKNARQGPDGWHYLLGNFNLGGTVSGRLSSSEPNLQNLPATGSKYAKLIKTCFQAPPGWLFCGIDFASLEDRISALTTKDPQKLKVYIDGYDGHSLRAQFYFAEEMPDIDPTSVESINSVQHKYKGLRQDSKAPTFALTYQGTYKTLMTNCGFTEERAKLIESRYHDLYVVSDKWVKDRLDEASQNGYVEAAFGLRVRTPLLKQVIRGTRKTPHEAEAEGRTAGNALGQSWCLLNSRAGSEFMGKVRKSRFALSIMPCAQIHDASYILVKDDIRIIHYCNIHLVKACEWQDDPLIWHDQVKLGGELSIFYPSWAEELSLPNNASIDQITDLAVTHFEKVKLK